MAATQYKGNHVKKLQLNYRAYRSNWTIIDSQFLQRNIPSTDGTSQAVIATAS